MKPFCLKGISWFNGLERNVWQMNKRIWLTNEWMGMNELWMDERMNKWTGDLMHAYMYDEWMNE